MLLVLQLDTSVLLWFNQFVHHSFSLDASIVVLSDSYLFKGGILMAAFWWQWFRDGDDLEFRREHLLVNMIACLIAIGLARTLAHLLPYRERPISVGIPGFRLAYTMSSDTLIHWSSFPSDHAAMFFALASGLWMARRRLGYLAFSYVLIVGCLPRIILGVHYPSDILGGAILGIASAFGVEKVLGDRWRGKWLHFWWSRRPPLLYALLFLLSYQIATMFADVRNITGLLARFVIGME
jgi:undecaprenyl-diphosphatase